MVNEITAELNDEQFKKYQIMQENNMSIGELIDLALEEKMEKSDEDLSDELDRVIREIDVVEKITDDTLDYDAKIKILEKEYAPVDDTYEMKVQAYKRGVKWGKFFEALK